MVVARAHTDLCKSKTEQILPQSGREHTIPTPAMKLLAVVSCWQRERDRVLSENTAPSISSTLQCRTVHANPFEHHKLVLKKRKTTKLNG